MGTPLETFFEQIEDNVSLLLHSKNHFVKWEPILNPIWVPEVLNRPQSTQIWCYMVCFLNHIVSILYKCGLRCGAVYYPL